MSTYTRWANNAQRQRFPPTPPEYQTAYLSPMSAVTEEAHAFYGVNRHQSKRAYSSRDHGDRYQVPSYSSHHVHGRQKQLPAVADYTMNYPQPLPMQYQYAPTVAPILPPIQVPDDMAYTAHYAHQQAELKPKDETPTGGVAQHLDYEMDMMANFVAEMCQQMVTRVSANPTSQFRKYVSQILSSTRLPSSTIMLGLFYLQERMKFEKGDLSSSSSLMKMLTTCLLLGSKFLDDNTFQNRSWAEVSNVAVQELNAMELQWLKDFNWEIHSLMYDPEQGFFMWIEHWHNYEEKAQVAQARSSQKPTPINTNISRHQAVPQPMLSPEGPIPPQYQQAVQYDASWNRPHISEYSPPSTQHSGPTTPDYYNNNWHYATMADTYQRSNWNPTKTTYTSQRPQISPYYAQYGQGYHPVNTWSPHGVQTSEYYVSHGYPVQSVVG